MSETTVERNFAVSLYSLSSETGQTAVNAERKGEANAPSEKEVLLASWPVLRVFTFIDSASHPTFVPDRNPNLFLLFGQSLDRAKYTAYSGVETRKRARGDERKSSLNEPSPCILPLYSQLPSHPPSRQSG